MDLFLSGKIPIFDLLQLRREISSLDSRLAAERRRESRELDVPLFAKHISRDVELRGRFCFN
jgi:hypothetical protein